MRQKRLFSIGILCALLAIGTHILSAAEKARSRVEIPKSIVEQVLNHAKLQGFLHPEAPGRVPVVISSHLINPRLSIRKFGKPVRIVPDAKLKSGAFLRFTNFDVGQNVANVRIKYQSEGMGGRFRFRQSKNGLWKLIETEVWEN